ncbi:MAG TPA: SRPBCC family protein [Nocardioidaceae bacterium]|nr:SRPBCC family protein [Nocardioidaceae bacterium]
MAEQTTSSILIAADPASVMAVISDFEAYPVWASGVKQAVPLADGAGGAVGAARRPSRVHFELDASPIKDAYTLHYEWQDDRAVTWTLVEGNMLRAMDGAYELEPRGEGTTEVTYRLAVDIAIPMIGMLKRKAEKVIIDTALKGLKKRVESLA